MPRTATANAINANTYSSLAARNKLGHLSRSKVFFGHKSVGDNIISGIDHLCRINPNLNINIIETKNLTRSDTGYLAHAHLGQNKDPLSKTREFVETIKSNLDQPPDIAIHKYCYVDITSESDIRYIFREYREYMDSLIELYPNVIFAHSTVPLTTIQTGPKAWIKKAINKRPYGIDDNIARNKYNEILLDTYGHTGRVFDLAKHEAMHSSGEHEHFKNDNTLYKCLNPALTDDGGHLNSIGKERISIEFLTFLESLAESNQL